MRELRKLMRDVCRITITESFQHQCVANPKCFEIGKKDW